MALFFMSINTSAIVWCLYRYLLHSFLFFYHCGTSRLAVVHAFLVQSDMGIVSSCIYLSYGGGICLTVVVFAFCVYIYICVCVCVIDVQRIEVQSMMAP